MPASPPVTFACVPSRFRVHEYNVDAAVMCALPYHATTQFVRLLQVLQLEGTRWVALSAVKAQGAPPSREALVRCFARDSSLLALVSDAALATAAPSARVARGGTTTFFTLLVSETVASMTRVPEDVLPRILPFVHAGLDKGATLDHHAGALLVISQLASRLQLARPLTEALLVAVAKASRAPLEPHTLQALLQLARTQSATTLPAHAVTYIAKLPRLPQLLADLSRHFSITALLQPLVCAFADRLGAHQMYHAVLLALVQDVVTDSCADALACRLILVAGLGAHGSQAADAAPSAAAASSAAKVLRALHCRWPAEVSRATSQALQQAQMRGIEQPLVAFLRDALAGTTSQPLQGDVCVTLGDGLAHESGRVREAALRDLTRSWQCTESTNGAVPADLARFERLRDALLRCVCDADAQVRMAALSVPGLADVVSDDAALFRAGAEALVASARTVRDTKATVGKVGVHRAIMKQALKLLCSTLPLRAPALRDSSARLLLGFVVGVRELQSAAQVARSLASSLGHHVFGDFRAQTCPTGDGAKDVAAAQRRVLSALGDALCSTATPEPLSWLQASWSDLSLDGQHTVLCALLRALSRSSADATAAGTLALAACNLLLDEPARLQAYSDAFADSRFEWEAGLPCAAYLDAWAPDDAAFAAVLRRKLMLDAIGLLPVVPVEDSTDGLGVFGDLFATLCSATASAPVLQPHVDAVLARAAARFSSRSLFLCLLSSACPSLVSEAAQVTALELLRSESDCEAGVPHVVVALTSPRRVVRKAAVDFLLATSSKADTVPGRKQTAKRSAQTSKMTDARSSLVAWAAEHGSSVVAGDCTTALPLLRAKLSAESAAPLRDSMLRLLKNSSGLPAYALVRALDVLRGAGSDEGVCAAVIPIWDSIRTLPLLGSEPLTQAAALICSMLASNIAARNDAAPAAGAALLSGLQNAVPAPVRVGALEAITPPVHAAMSASYQDLLLASCALFLSREEHQSCRDAARALLDRVPLDGLSFVRVLESTCASVNGRAIAQPAAKRRTAGDALPLLPCDAQPLEVLTAVLEVLSWKEVEDGEQLALAVENAASFLLDAVSAASSQERVEASDESADASGDADETGRPALEYCVHLTLRVLTLFVEGAVRDNAACARIALRALREVMEAGVHGAALELLTTIATVTPDCVVANVLDVIQTLTSKATSDISGRGSVKALGEAFRAIAGCWTLARDDDGSELLQHVVASLPAMHEHQRLPLLASVLRALPSPVALSLVVQLLISHRNESDESASFHALASMLCASRSPLECLQAMSALMRRSTQPAETASAAEFAVVQLALVAGQGESSSCALSELIALGVERLQSLAEVSEQSADVRRASQCTQSLLTTVERLMSPLSFLKAVALLFESPGQRVQRRALRICLARIRGSSGNLPSAVDEHAGSALIAPLAALARCSQKSACTTRCLALETLAALVERCGQSQEFATSLLPVIPDVLSAASHAKPLVAARGLQCVAAAVMMLSTRLVPLLPGMMTAVIGVLDSDNGDVLRLCAALDTVTAMVARLDVFLSPYAQKLVHLLLSPRFVADGVRQAAATAREMLARRLPARILVGPLTSAWGDVLSSGAGLAVALLHQLTKLIDTLDAPDAAVHHEAIFGASSRGAQYCPRVAIGA